MLLRIWTNVFFCIRVSSISAKNTKRKLTGQSKYDLKEWLTLNRHEMWSISSGCECVGATNIDIYYLDCIKPKTILHLFLFFVRKNIGNIFLCCTNEHISIQINMWRVNNPHSIRRQPLGQKIWIAQNVYS